MRQIAPESSPERSANSLSHSFFVVPFLSPTSSGAWRSYLLSSKFVENAAITGKLSGIVSCDSAAIRIRIRIVRCQRSRAAKRGCFKRGGFPIWTRPSFLSFFVLFGTFPDFSGIFPICLGMVWGFSRFVLFLFLGLLRAPTRNSPERVRDTIWTFPEKSGKHPGLETPRFSFSQNGPRNVKNTNLAKHRPAFLPPLLLVGSKESVLKVPKRRQFHAAIRVTTKRCDSCAQGALGRRKVSRRNFCDAESLAKRCGETCH